MNEQNNQTEQTRQTEQNTNVNQSQQSGTQNRNNGGFPGFFFPLNFIFGERPRRPNENNSQQDDSQGAQQQEQQQQQQQQQQEEEGQQQQQQEEEEGQQQQQQQQEEGQQQNHHHHHRHPQVQFFIYPISGDGQNTPAGVFFFSPFFIPQEVHKPRASESAINNLPIIIITKEHVDSQASCPICFEPFSVSIGQEENKKEESQNVVRQMPCNHMFCESCLFQWLRQNNTCPLCRKEIEAEEPQTQQNDNNTTDNTFPPFIQIINVDNDDSLPTSPPLSTTNTNTTTTTTNTEQSNSNSNNNNNNNTTQNSHSSCALETVGCCEETDNNVSTPIITLPQCHHRFHASCLRTSLLVEGYSLGDFNSISQPLNFHCPTCRAPAIVQSDVLKMPSIPQNNERQEQQVIPFNLPITIHIPESDDMDLD